MQRALSENSSSCLPCLYAASPDVCESGVEENIYPFAEHDLHIISDKFDLPEDDHPKARSRGPHVEKDADFISVVHLDQLLADKV